MTKPAQPTTTGPNESFQRNISTQTKEMKWKFKYLPRHPIVLEWYVLWGVSMNLTRYICCCFDLFSNRAIPVAIQYLFAPPVSTRSVLSSFFQFSTSAEIIRLHRIIIINKSHLLLLLNYLCNFSILVAWMGDFDWNRIISTAAIR